MRNLLALIAALGLVSAVACKKDEDKKAEAPAEEPTADEPTADEPKADEPTADEPSMANKMQHCPASVEGVETKIEGGDGTVIVTVTGKDEAAAEIRKRAAYLVGLNDADASEIKHSGEGTGGGGLGKCPVIVGQATLAAEDVEGGSKITMTPKKPEALAELLQMAKDRAAGMMAGAAVHGHGAGTGGGKHHDHGSGEHHGDGSGGGKGGHMDKPAGKKGGIDAGAK